MFISPAISDLSTNPSLFILLATIPLVNLLQSAVVIHLDLMSDIFVS